MERGEEQSRAQKENFHIYFSQPTFKVPLFLVKRRPSFHSSRVWKVNVLLLTSWPCLRQKRKKRSESIFVKEICIKNFVSQLFLKNIEQCTKNQNPYCNAMESTAISAEQ